MPPSGLAALVPPSRTPSWARSTWSIFASCADKGSKLGVASEPAASRIVASIAPQRATPDGHAVVERRQLLERHRGERRVDLVLVGRRSPVSRRHLPGGDVDVAQAERAVLHGC